MMAALGRHICGYLAVLSCTSLQDHDVTGPAPVIGQAEAEAGEAGLLQLTPVDDDLALQAALYGLVIQSYADKV